MGAEAALTPAVLPVDPGGEAAAEFTVANKGAVVDSFAVEVLGPAAAWAVAEPAVLSLFPAQSGSVRVTFRPPAGPGTAPGPLPFAVRAASAEDPAHSAVEEAVLQVAGIPVLGADISPRTGRARGTRAGRYRLAVDNRGNAPVLVEAGGWDGQDLLAVTVEPPQAEVPPGAAVLLTVRARARHRFWRGPAVLHRATVGVRPAQGSTAAPDPLDVNLLQEAAVPGWVGKALTWAVLGAVALAALWFTVLKPVVKDAATSATQQALANAGLPAGGGSGGGGGGGGASPSPTGSPSGGGPATPAPSASNAAAATSPFALELDLNHGQLTAGAAQVYAVTDLVLQNPAGDTGSLTISRGGKTLISTRLENFRDYDLHFVTAIALSPGQSLSISVNCDKPGGGDKSCTPAVLVSGTARSAA